MIILSYHPYMLVKKERGYFYSMKQNAALRMLSVGVGEITFWIQNSMFLSAVLSPCAPKS